MIFFQLQIERIFRRSLGIMIMEGDFSILYLYTEAIFFCSGLKLVSFSTMEADKKIGL